MAQYSLSDIVYPECDLCRNLRISMVLSAILVLLTYLVQLWQIGQGPAAGETDGDGDGEEEEADGL